jgi:UDP-GlcNAc:undecaprenyl-phosphate GlcNAc-1-phosphate transferase
MPLKAVTACLIVFAVPLIDTSLAIFRRKLRGDPILSPDKQHIHHMLRRRGLSVRQAVLVLYAVAAGFAVIGVSMVWLDFRWRYMLAVFVVVYGFVTVMAWKAGVNRQDAQPASTDTPAANGEQRPSPPAAPNGNGNGHHHPTPDPADPIKPPGR